MCVEFRRSARGWLIAFGLAVAALAATASGQTPGGMPPSYTAADHDERLTEIARSALPIVAALERYRTEHGRYPDNVAAAALRVAGAAARDIGTFVAFGDWLYYRDADGLGFSLSRKLGWDPRLIYRRSAAREIWVFDPGDGSAEKEIVLKP